MVLVTILKFIQDKTDLLKDNLDYPDDKFWKR